MEDEVYTTTQEMPDDPDFLARFPDGVYYQRNIIRKTLTPMYGVAVEYGEDEVVLKGMYDTSWNAEKMSAIAILSRSADNDLFNRNVINCCQAAAETAGGVADEVADEVVDIRIYDLKGIEVDAKSLAPGVYVMRQTSANGVVKTRKIVR